VFVAQVKVDEKVVGVGEGRTKKEAEQMAANRLWRILMRKVFMKIFENKLEF